MKTSSGKKSKKSRLTKERKRAIALANLAKGSKRKTDWIKLRNYRVNRLAGMNRYQAAVKAGYAHSTARHQIQRVDRLANIGIIQALENAGATNQIMAEQLTNIAMTATKREQCTIEVHEEDGEIIVDDKAEETVPDLNVRVKTWELIAKLKQHLRPNAMLPEGNFKRLVIVVEKDIGPDDQQSIAERARRADPIDIPSRIRVETADQQG